MWQKGEMGLPGFQDGGAIEAGSMLTSSHHTEAVEVEEEQGDPNTQAWKAALPRPTPGGSALVKEQKTDDAGVISG